MAPPSESAWRASWASAFGRFTAGFRSANCHRQRASRNGRSAGPQVSSARFSRREGASPFAPQRHQLRCPVTPAVTSNVWCQPGGGLAKGGEKNHKSLPDFSFGLAKDFGSFGERQWFEIIAVGLRP